MLILFSALQLFAQLPDSEVIKLLKEAQQQGKSQQETLLLLTRRGVTKEQLLRLKAEYESMQEEGGGTTGKKSDRTRGVSGTKSSKQNTENNRVKQNTENYRTKQNTKKVYTKAESADFDSVGYFFDAENEFLKKPDEKPIFGRDIFNNQLLTFEPNLSIATPDNYRLGAGDEVIVDIWGASESTIRQSISPDGCIVVENIGPIYLNGLTVKEAGARLKRELGKIYSGVQSSDTHIKLSLGKIRSIQVNVMGEVFAPGTYTFPSLATVFHALYGAGGVSSIGTLRSVKVNRAGQTIADIDIYDYIMEGKNDLDIVLQDGDVIVVSPYTNLIELMGKIKRPMIYEIKDTESVNDLLRYAGGFTGDAYKNSIRVIRKSGREHQVYNVDAEEFGDFSLLDGDVVSVDSVLSRFENKVEVRGAVYREGLYALGTKVKTLKQLIDKAEGIRGDAFRNRAVLYRENPDLTINVESIDIDGLVSGATPDIELRKNDILYIPSIFDMQEEYTIAVKGAVGYPGTFRYVGNMTLEDLIVQAGGLKESASTVKIDVSRRIKNPKSTDVGNLRAETYTFTLKDGLVVGGEKGFTLQPFDEVFVRTSPGYQTQRNVTIEGEVLFDGEYTIARKGQRISDLVNKAGGLTAEAYPEGARLLRRMTPEELMRFQTTLKMAAKGGKDSIDMKQLETGDSYFVGIELKKALENPGTDYDVVLCEGDRLTVPEYNGTVKINGAVMYPNTVVYKPKGKLKDYIAQAGGFAQRAKKGRAFVVYMNGTVDVGKNAKILPGCEIIIPTKQPRKGVGLTEIMSLASSTTSMAAMVTSIMNMTK